MDKKKKIICGFILFLLVMLCCYLISRGIYANNLVRVDAVEQEVMSLNHSVNVAGTVSSGQQKAVFVQKNLPVSQVQVRIGDQIEAGGVLFTCDLDSLSELVKEKEAEVAALELQLQTLSQNEQLAAEEKKRRESRALEDYQDTLDAAETGVKRAGEDAGWADEQLNRHEQTKVQETPEEERNSRREAYQSYLGKVQEAQAAVDAASAKVKACQEQIQEKEEDVKLEEAQSALENLQEELEQAKASEEQAKQTLQELMENPMQEPDFSAEDTAKKQWEDTQSNLEKNAQTAKRGLEDANAAREEALQNASRAVEDAETPLPADCTYETLSLELEAKEEQLEEYSLLLENEGRVYAKQTGLVVGVHIEAGGWTSAQAAFLLADTENGFLFEAHLSREEKQYVSRNMQALVSLSGNQSLKGKVDYLTESPLGDGSFDVAVRLEEGVGNPGESGILKTSIQTELYGCCVPLEALHRDFNQRDYVFVLVETEGILGTELSVRKQYVQVLDKSDTFAALEPGVLGAEEKIITYASKELQDGDIVRMRN